MHGEWDAGLLSVTAKVTINCMQTRMARIHPLIAETKPLDILALHRLDDTRNKCVLQSTIDERLALEDRKDGRRWHVVDRPGAPEGAALAMEARAGRLSVGTAVARAVSREGGAQ